MIALAVGMAACPEAMGETTLDPGGVGNLQC